MKKSIREKILEKRNKHRYAEEDSKRIIDKLINLPQLKKADTIMLYYPHKNEVNILPLFYKLSDKTFLFPKTTSEDILPVKVDSLDNFSKGRFGILEPQGELFNPKDIDIVIVPAVAFDETGHRIGYGKGYYDRFLKKTDALKIGVAYDFQVLDKFPTEHHDIPVDLIVTPTKIIKIKEELRDV
ncbi:5-formyltetrahydrofolate cyclo-ligase [Hydrogenothermus marinus]|uniref:5-formyltetrahydrofolate cyclo-ligase n=1 Tax=Hydrogenothermus marinus TaxID=133270 RepID=A0A3M0B7V2_9AQUI|nr:5-formyltetrahydrofolate cyclo-ligase [Hydrogenothermus marinus]RMA93197.1 5-formyltetrahydrofolate cyclo-ligase [Hydrogenothermus marinus]